LADVDVVQLEPHRIAASKVPAIMAVHRHSSQTQTRVFQLALLTSFDRRRRQSGRVEPAADAGDGR
jgi:hypothetical protein